MSGSCLFYIYFFLLIIYASSQKYSSKCFNNLLEFDTLDYCNFPILWTPKVPQRLICVKHSSPGSHTQRLICVKHSSQGSHTQRLICVKHSSHTERLICVKHSS